MQLFNLPKQSYRWLFAELVVVILGILIAFQVDEWREERSSELEERTILFGLRDEFIVNIETLAQVTSRLSIQQSVLKDFLYKSPDEITLYDYSRSTNNLIVAMHRSLTNRGITNGILNATISTGMLASISSQQLQAGLLEIEDYEREIELLADDLRNLTDSILIELGRYSSPFIPFWDEDVAWDTVDQNTISSTLAEMREDQILIPFIAAKTQRIGPYIGVQNRLIDHLQNVLDLIEQELT